MRAALLCCVLLLCSHSATAQIDAIIDAVVGAVEPTPVYDTGLRDYIEGELVNARQKAMDEMEQRARNMGANACQLISMSGRGRKRSRGRMQ